MKKILAVAIAVAMLATMSIGAAAALPTAGGQGVIVFDTWGGPTPPTTGPHNPQDPGSWPTDPGGQGPWPAWVQGLQSWNLDFGVREIPTTIGVHNFNSSTAVNAAGAPITTTNRLGVVVQAMTQTPANVSITGNFTLQAGLGQIQNGGNQTMNGYTLALVEVDGAVNTTASRQSMPAAAAGGPTSTQTNALGATQGLVQGAAAATSGAVMTVLTGPPGIHGAEWFGILNGSFTGLNIVAGTSQGQLFWTFTIAP